MPKEQATKTKCQRCHRTFNAPQCLPGDKILVCLCERDWCQKCVDKAPAGEFEFNPVHWVLYKCPGCQGQQ
jgi:hypothetical protein